MTKRSQVKLNFKMKAQLSYGQALFLVGDIPELGSYNIPSSIRFNCDLDHIWTTSIYLPNNLANKFIHFKYVVASWDTKSHPIPYYQHITHKEKQIKLINKSSINEMNFSIKKHVDYGKAVYIIGNHPIFGSWDITRALKLKWNQNDIWTAQVPIISPFKEKIDFQIVVADWDNPNDLNCTWQTFLENRTLEVSDDKDTLSFDGVWNYIDISMISLSKEPFIFIQQKPFIKEKIKMNSMKDCDVGLQTKLTINEKGQEQIKFSAKSLDPQKQLFKKDNIQEVFKKLEQMKDQNKQVTALLCDEIMNKPLTDQQQKINENLIKNFKQKVEINNGKNGFVLQQALIQLKQQFQAMGLGEMLTFSQSSSVRTQMGIKALSTNFMMNQIKCQQVLENQDYKYTFQDISQDQKKLQQFEKWYKQEKSKQTGIPIKDIVIHKITNCCIKVQWSTTNGQNIQNAAQNNKKLKLHAYFQHFNISPQDFDSKGNFQFSQNKNDVQRRGRVPYYQPVYGKRYGLKVMNRYEDDIWIKMQNVPKQWAVAFHGVNYPDNASNGGKKVLNCIIDGIKQGTMLQAGGGQAYQGSYSLNKPQQRVGRGIYCSPHFQECLSGYTRPVNVNNKGYRLIFQCRVNPNAIKVCSNNVYWVINNSKDIRPYGIILIKESDVSKVPSIQKQFNETFTWDKYKQQLKNIMG